MIKNDIIRLIEEKYIYIDFIEGNYKKKWEKLKTIIDENYFFEELYHFLNNDLDPHTKLIDKNKYNYILPIFFTVMNDEVVVVDCLTGVENVKRGYKLTHIDDISVSNYIKNSNIDSFQRGRILELVKVIEKISSSDEQKKNKIMFYK